MNNALRNIAELCRHEYLRERRSMHFTRNIIIWSLKIVLWTSMALALPRTLESAGISIGEGLPLLLLTDQIIRWFSQSTPAYNALQYRLMPIRNWHAIAAYLLRMLFMPINFIWLPALWPQWWLISLFILSGYMYLACWHAFLSMTRKRGTQVGSSSSIAWGGGLLSCELKIRMRHPSLSRKIRNGLIVSIMLTAMSIMMESEAYTDFAILYTLTFPTLPMLTARFGYEQPYMSLLRTRMHGFGALYRAKYIASLLAMLPCICLLLIPIVLGAVSAGRLLGWTIATGFVIYPTLLLCAPRSEIGSPTAQFITLLTLTLPIILTQIISNTL